MKKRITALLLLLTLSVTSLFACTSADKSESASDKPVICILICEQILESLRV